MSDVQKSWNFYNIFYVFTMLAFRCKLHLYIIFLTVLQFYHIGQINSHLRTCKPQFHQKLQIVEKHVYRILKSIDVIFSREQLFCDDFVSWKSDNLKYVTSLKDDFLSDLDTTSVFYFPLSTSFSSYCRDDNISNDISAAKRKKTKSKENSSMMGWVRSSLSSFLTSILLCFTSLL